MKIEIGTYYYWRHKGWAKVVQVLRISKPQDPFYTTVRVHNTTNTSSTITSCFKRRATLKELLLADEHGSVEINDG